MIIRVRAADLLALVQAVVTAKNDPNVGFEDANTTYEKFVSALNSSITIESDLIEGALWSANLLNEKLAFSHPTGKSFNQMLSDITPTGYKFNLDYNYFQKEGEDVSKTRRS